MYFPRCKSDHFTMLEILEWFLIAFMIKTHLLLKCGLQGHVWSSSYYFYSLISNHSPFALSHTILSVCYIPSCRRTFALVSLFAWTIFTPSSKSFLALLTRSNPPLINTYSTIFSGLLLVMVEVSYDLYDYLICLMYQQ